MVAEGRLGADGVFAADTILAKHDENYMPPEVADMLEEGARRAGAGGMIVETGHFALVLALVVALIQATVPLVGAWRGDAAAMAVARPPPLRCSSRRRLAPSPPSPTPMRRRISRC